MNLPTPKIIPAPLIHSALVVDTLDAERMLIIDRNSGSRVSHFRVKDGSNIRVLPRGYGLEPKLSVIIYDDDNQYNAAIADNVQAMLVDMFTFDPNNPQPFESP